MNPGSTTYDHNVVERCVHVLNHRPAGILTDIDGTVSPMARTPGEAVVAPVAKDALERLRNHVELVGVVTGRSALVAEALVEITNIVYVGNHGMEWIERGELHHHASAAAWSDTVRSALIEIADIAARDRFDDGLIVEDKGLSGSIHFRLAPDVERTHTLLTTTAVAVGDRTGLRITEGRMVIEIRPPVEISKGTAVRDLVRDRGLKGIVFLGDDVTDVDAFKAVRELRDSDGIAGLRIGVTSAETPQSVLDESDVTVPGVEACAMLLAAVADRLESADEH